MALLALPKYFALELNGQYLSYVQEEGNLHGHLRFSDTGVSSPLTKFEVESSTKSDSLVHIKCSYNKKYLVRPSLEAKFLVADMDSPVEDIVRPDCTMFQASVTKSTSDLFVKFNHHSKNSVSAVVRYQHKPSDNHCKVKHNDCLSIDTLNVQADMFRVIDLTSLVLLPPHVVFKDENERYLSSKSIDNCQYLEFSGDDISDPTVWYEVDTLPNGTVRIKSLFSNKHWCLSQDSESAWICADDSSTKANIENVFQPVRLGNNGDVIALKSLGNGKYCKGLTLGDKKSRLSASDNENAVTGLKIVDAVINRRIFDCVYRIKDAVIKQGIESKQIKTVTNMSAFPQQSEIVFTFTKKRSDTWSSYSWKGPAPTTITAGVPILVQDTIIIGETFSGSYTWGQPRETTTTETMKISIFVAPMSKVTVTLVTREGIIHVPFSYTQQDLLGNGTVYTYKFNDGIFTGVNSDFYFDISEESL